MYYYTTSTLDINLETASVNPETQTITLVIYTSTSTSGSTTISEPTSTPKLTTAARIAALERLILENNDASHLRRVDMARILGVGLSRIKDDLRLLAAQGKVVFVGAGSHSGHWHLVGNPETEAEVEQWLSTPGYALLHGSRGRHATPSTSKRPLLPTTNHTSTLRETMTSENKVLSAAHISYAHRRNIYCAIISRKTAGMGPS